MKLLVGLGNPGTQYEKTRHNAGYMVIDRLLNRHVPGASNATAKGRFDGLTWEASIKGERCLLLKPTTYMNLSGRSVAAAVGFYKLDPKQDLLVITDDVALPCGTIRLRAEGGAGGHNGLTDVERALGTQAYPRCRIGVDASPDYMDQADYVLGRFTPEQEPLITAALDKATDAAEMFVAQGIVPAMNKFNAPPPRPKPPRKDPPPGKEAPGQSQRPPDAA